MSDCSDDSSSEESSGEVHSESSDASSLEEGFCELLPPTISTESILVRKWTEDVVIRRLKLCPWAIRSNERGRIRYQTYTGTTREGVMDVLRVEAHALLNRKSPWCTTLVVCPHVRTWTEDFPLFDQFVRGINLNIEMGNEETLPLSDHITLVAFHPRFIKWRGLPDCVGVGSHVFSFRNQGYGQKSADASAVTVTETRNPVFGKRKVKVRFDSDQKEQYVPVDWLQVEKGPLLPDNAMHQSPFPAIHLICNADLARLRARDVSRVKRLNAHRMSELSKSVEAFGTG